MERVERPERAKAELIAIDLLRLASALAVVAFHFGASFWLKPDPYARSLLGAPGAVPASASWTWWGWVGVEIFFVISGFVIAWSASASGALDFARRRFLRLIPAAWICATITLGALAFVGVAPLTEHLREWLRTVSFYPYGRYIDPSYWTLAVEVSFYLGVFLLLLRGQAARLEPAARALGLASALFWCVFLAKGASPTEVLSNRELQLLLLTHGCFFALGVQLWAIQQSGATPARLLWAALFYGAGLVETAAHTAERTTSLGLSYGPLIPICAFTGAVAVVAAAHRLQPPLERLIRPALGRRLGLMTYPLYLIHQIFGAAVLALLLPRLGRTAAVVEVVAMVLLLTLLLVEAEARLRRRLSGLFDRFRGRRSVVRAPA